MKKTDLLEDIIARMREKYSLCNDFISELDRKIPDNVAYKYDLLTFIACNAIESLDQSYHNRKEIIRKVEFFLSKTQEFALFGTLSSKRYG